jgi:tRNA(Ile)-lysidine synthase
MVLLRVLHTLARNNAWRLTVAHLNHRLRGRSSDADEALVRRTARQLHLPAVIDRVEVRRFARQHKVSLEMAARDRRHDFLARAAARLRVSTVALAHQADDQLELFFLRLLRGAGGEGLAGMKWRSRSPKNRRVELVRPLLDLSKEALSQFAREQKVPFREDASNTWLDIPRNRVRRELLPLLRKRYQAALDKTIFRTMDLAGAEAELAIEVARDWLQARALGAPKPSTESRLKRKPVVYVELAFNKLPVAVQRRCLQLQLFELGFVPDFDLTERLRLNPGKLLSASFRPPRTNVSWLRREMNGQVQLQVPVRQENAIANQTVLLHGSSGSFEFGGIKVTWRIRQERGSRRARQFGTCCEFFDADTLGGAAVLRHWHPGDRFQPIGMSRAVKLQDLFTNLKIPRQERHELVLASTAKGEVFWVEGFRIAERFKLTRGTIRRLQWTWKRL